MSLSTYLPTVWPENQTVELSSAHKRALVIGVVLTAFDAVATWIAIMYLGAAEANPTVDALIARFGLTNAMVMRTLIGVAFLGMLYTIGRRAAISRRALLLAPIPLGCVALYHFYGMISSLM